jgi:hypothetical protein
MSLAGFTRSAYALAREKTTTAKGSKRVGMREGEEGKGMWK